MGAMHRTLGEALMIDNGSGGEPPLHSQVLEAQGGELTDAQQRDIVGLCERMDKAGVYHNDANPLNLMVGAITLLSS